MSRYRQTFTEALQQVEKWSKDVEVKSTGEHAGKTIDQLKSEVDALRGKPNNEKEMGGLLFAIRAKQGWKKGEGSTGVEEATQIKHERGEVKTDKAERGERKAGESDDDYEDRESGGKRGLRPNPFEKKKKQNDDEAKESTLPPHLSKFLDKKGNPNKEAQARIDAGKKKRAVATKVKDVTPKGYGPSEEVELAIMSIDHKEAPRKLKISQKGLDALRAARDKPKEKSTKLRITKTGRAAVEEVEIDELSTDLLGRYKTKAAAQSSAAAKAGDHKKSHKRYKGVNTATTLQFRNDAKKEDMSLAPKGKGRKAAQAMYGVKEDLEFKVTIKGIPPFYVPAKTAAAVKQSLRKQLKHPDDIESIVRVTKAAQKIDYRKRAQGKSDEDDNKK